MRGMVKLNDLEDLAEPPLDGAPEALSLTLRKHEGMDMDIAAGRGAGAPSNAQYGPDDANVGLE